MFRVMGHSVLALKAILQVTEVRKTSPTGTEGHSWDAEFFVLKLRKSQSHQDKLIMLLGDHLSFNRICVYVCDMHGSRSRIPLAHVQRWSCLCHPCP